jgi:hypothetical protein
VNILLAFFTGSLAADKGYSSIGWILLVLFFGLLPFFILLALPKFNNASKQNSETGRYSPIQRMFPDSGVICKICVKKIELGYTRCPYCGGELNSENNEYSVVNTVLLKNVI